MPFWSQLKLEFLRARITHFTCLLICTIGLQAQDINKIQEYRNGLNRANDSRRFDLLCKISFEYRNSFPDSTVYYGSQAYSLGEKLNLSKGLARPLSFIALGYSAKGDLVSSFRYHDQAINVAIRQNDSLQVGYAHNNIGRILLEVKDFTRAEENFNSALQIFQAVGDQSGIAYALRSLSEVLVGRNDFIGALDLLEKAYQIRKSAGDKRATISALLEVSTVHRKLNDYAEAEKHLHEALELSMDLSDKETDAEVLMAMIELNLSKRARQKVVELIGSAGKIIENLNNNQLQLKFLVLAGKAYKNLQLVNDATAFLLKARTLAQKLNNPVLEKETIEQLINLNAANNNSFFKSRLIAAEEAISRNEINAASERLDLQLLVQKSEIEKQQLKIKLTEEQVKAERQRADNLALLILFITFLAGVLLTAFFLVRQRLLNRQLRRQNEIILSNKAEMTEANDRLELQNRELQELSAEKDSLMSIVAHDLRTPLSHISGFAQLLRLEGKLTDTQSEYVDRIGNTVQHGYRLVNDILDINNYKSTDDKPRYEVIRLKEFSDALFSNFSKSASLKNIDLQFSLTGETEFITDRTLLTRILENLISNGLKFSPKNSNIRVEISAAGDSLLVIVADSGPGFTEEDISGMFRQFKKLSARPTAGEPSNGLGLAIVKHIASKLGGTVELTSKPRQSAVFRVTLPKGTA